MAYGRFAPDRDRVRPAHIALAAAILVVGAWLRVRGAQGELWLDEIWSLNTAQGLSAWHEAFWNAPNDNNHPFNTAWMYLVGQDQAPWVYRLLSIATGTLGVLAAGLVAARRAPSNTPARLLIAMLLAATLYPFVHFGSEARGYAPMMLCALLAFAAVENADRDLRSARWSYGLIGTIGVLSHLGILPVLFALSVSFAGRQMMQGRTFLQAVNGAVRLNGPFMAGVLAYMAAIWYGIYTGGNLITFGGSTLACPGGDCFTLALDEITRFSSGGFGAHLTGLHSGLYGILVFGAVVWLGAVGNRRALPLGLIMLGVPLLFFAANQPAAPHGRYFLAVFAFMPLLIAEVIGELSARAKAARMFAGLLVLALVLANTWAVNRFVQAGRGDYARALEHMLAEQGGAPLTIGTEMPFQLTTVMEHTRRRTAPDQRIDYAAFPEIADARPPWVISVTIEPRDLRPQTCAGGLLYTLDSVHTYWGLAGSTWGLYSLSDSPAPADCLWLTESQN